MPKKIFAVTNVKIGPDADGWFAAGSVIDRAKFTDEQLLELHRDGAIEIRTVDEPTAPNGAGVEEVVDQEPETPETPAPEETAPKEEETPEE